MSRPTKTVLQIIRLTLNSHVRTLFVRFIRISQMAVNVGLLSLLPQSPKNSLIRLSADGPMAR